MGSRRCPRRLRRRTGLISRDNGRVNIAGIARGGRPVRPAESQRERADFDFMLGLPHRCCRDAAAGQQRTVLTTFVRDADGLAFDCHFGMEAGNLWVIEDDVAIGGAADLEGARPFQNALFVTASTTMPSARSLSATIAVTVGDPTFVPAVWSLGSRSTCIFGISPAASNRFSSPMNRSARFTSG